MTNIEQLLDELIKREGGYVDHPADRGGPTRYGITLSVARANGYTGHMSQLPLETAKSIYRRRYWTGPNFDGVAKVSPRIAAELFDSGVNAGPKRAATWLQRALNVLNRGELDYPDLKLDGAIGARTIEALVAFFVVRRRDAEEVLMKALEAYQGCHYLTLAEAKPSQEAFVFGWLKHRLGNA